MKANVLMSITAKNISSADKTELLEEVGFLVKHKELSTQIEKTFFNKTFDTVYYIIHNV